MKLSIVIPAHNEEGCIRETILTLSQYLRVNCIDFEIVVVNDHSTDNTKSVLQDLGLDVQELRVVENTSPSGFGFAVRTGLNNYQGDAVVIVMGDGSENPENVLRFFLELEKGYDCVFGSRFIRGGTTTDYPVFKLFLNRLANSFIRIVLGLKYNDVTNAFKMYRREAIDGLRPFLSHHFNLTIELPLKAITRGFTYSVLPNDWINRKTGASKLKIKEMGSRYLFIMLYVLIEKWLSVGDYRKNKEKTDSTQRCCYSETRTKESSFS